MKLPFLQASHPHSFEYAFSHFLVWWGWADNNMFEFTPKKRDGKDHYNLTFLSLGDCERRWYEGSVLIVLALVQDQDVHIADHHLWDSIWRGDLEHWDESWSRWQWCPCWCWFAWGGRMMWIAKLKRCDRHVGFSLKLIWPKIVSLFFNNKKILLVDTNRVKIWKCDQQKDRRTGRQTNLLTGGHVLEMLW